MAFGCVLPALSCRRVVLDVTVLCCFAGGPGGRLPRQVYTRVHLNGFYLDYWSFAIMIWMMHTRSKAWRPSCLGD